MSRSEAALILKAISQKQLRRQLRALEDRQIEFVWTYARVSSEEQAKGFSPETQREDCQVEAKRRGWALGEHVADVPAEGGIVLSRRGIIEIVTKLRAMPAGRRPQALLIRNTDRLARNSVEGMQLAVQLLELGVVVRSVEQREIDETPEGWKRLVNLLADAECNNLTRAKGSHRGIRAADLRGLWPRRAPYGYRASEIDATTRRPTRIPEVDPDAAREVQGWFNRLADGENRIELYRDAKRKGVGPATREQFYKIFLNRFYVGIHPSTSTKAQWEPIIGEVLWKRSQARASSPRGVWRTARTYLKQHPEYPHKELLICAECGHRPTVSAEGKPHKRKPYYKCSRCRIRWRRERIETAFLAELEKLRILPEYSGSDWQTELLTSARRFMDDFENRRREAARRCSEAERRFVTGRDAFMASTVSSLRPELEGRLSELQDEREAAQRALELVESQRQRLDSDLVALATKARAAGADLPAVWRRATPSQRTTLQTLIFPHGLIIERSGGFLPPVTAPIFGQMSTIGRSESAEQRGWWT